MEATQFNGKRYVRFENYKDVGAIFSSLGERMNTVGSKLPAEGEYIFFVRVEKKYDVVIVSQKTNRWFSFDFELN